MYLAPFLAAVDATHAERLAGKRRDFRAAEDFERLRDLMSEMHTLLWLHRHGLRPDFGPVDGSPTPDLVLSDLGLGLEVTRLARPEIGWRLVRVVFDEVLRCRPRPRATIHLSGRPVTVRASVLEALKDEVRLSLEHDHSPVFAVLRPARGDSPAITARITFDRPSGSVIPTLVAPPSGWSLLARQDVEELVSRVLVDKRKRRQGEAMPTVLCVDVGGLMPAITRSAAGAWSVRLAEILDEHRHRTSFAALALVAFGDGSTAPRVALGISPPSSVVYRWGKVMGLTER